MTDYKILLIDYEPRSIQKLLAPLQAAGYTVHVAEDGIAGIEAFRQLKPDVTLIEAMIPKRHGFEVCLALKQTEHGKKSSIIVVTGVYKGRKYRSQAVHQYKCDEYMEKPFTDEVLLETVRRHLARVAGTLAPKAAAPEVPPTQPGLESGTETQAARTATSPQTQREAEIGEKLDELLGKGTSDKTDPESSVDVTNPDSENVVSFDPDRSRKWRNDVADGAAVEGVAAGPRVAGNAVPRPASSHVPVEQVSHTEVPDPQPAPRTAPWIWIAVAIVIAGGLIAAALILK